MRKIGLFRRKKQEIRADTEKLNILALGDFLEGCTASLGKNEALEIPTVQACIGKVAETISRLPIKLYRRSNGKVEEITDDIRIKLLNGETGDTLNSVDMWRSVIEDYYLGNGAWIFINSDGIKVKSLHYVDCRNIGIMQNTDPIFKAFEVTVGGRRYYDFQFIRLFRKTRDGYTNIPIQDENPTALAAAFNALRLEDSMNSRGGGKAGFLKSKNKLSAEAVASIRNNYENLYSNGKNKKVVVLNEGIEFQEISSTAAELQLNENKRTNSTEICKIFGFPHTIIDGGATDDDNKKFTSAVVSILNQIETALDISLLLETEKEQGYYWAFDVKELTRGSILERFQAYAIARQNNILQVDEIRREEDYEPLGFNYIQLGLDDVLLNPVTMDIYTPNTGQTKNLVTGEERAEIELRYNGNHDKRGAFCFRQKRRRRKREKFFKKC